MLEKKTKAKKQSSSLLLKQSFSKPVTNKKRCVDFHFNE